MAEALAIPSAIAGLLSLTITTIQLSHRYFSGVKSASRTVKAYFREIERLKTVLLEFEQLARNPNTAPYISQPNTEDTKACQEELGRLHTTLQKKSQGGTFSRSLSSLTWPFSEEEVARTVETFSRYQNFITNILTGAGLMVSAANRSELKHLREVLLEHSAQISYKWLSTIDPASNHQFARTKHSQGTGQWFLELPQFASWLKSSFSSLWVNAISGAGKTVLCSTIIEHVRERRPDEALAYFYLDANDSTKSTLNACLRSLLAQLCYFHTTTPEIVAELKSLSENPGRNGFLGDQELLHAIISVCSGPHRCRIVIDALDEGAEREELLEAVKLLAVSSSASLLVTSRRELDIEETISDVMDESVALEAPKVREDIRAFVAERLRTDSKLKRRPQSVKKRIEEVLTAKSAGMFRWADCQIDALRLCVTQNSIEEALNSLPRTLDATYERILLRIDQAHVRLARAALEFVIFCKKSPTLIQVAEAAVVGSLEDSFDIESRNQNQLFEPEEILRICSSLLVFEDPFKPEDPAELEDPVKLENPFKLEGPIKFEDPFNYNIEIDDALAMAQKGNDSVSDHDSVAVHCSVSDHDSISDGSEIEDNMLNRRTVRPAHYSVNEYLLSTRIRASPARSFAMSQGSGDMSMTRMCLRYLLLFDSPDPYIEDFHRVFSLTQYAANFWYKHLTAAVLQHDLVTRELLGTFLDTKSHYCFLNAIRSSYTDKSSRLDRRLEPSDLHSPLHYLCRDGACSELIKFAINLGCDVNVDRGFLGPPLAVAISGNCDMDTLDILLEAGANVNARGGLRCTALNAAVVYRAEEKLARLLDAGADPCITLDEFDLTALHSACEDAEISVDIIHKLLEAGADVNAVHTQLGTPLVVAADQSRIDIVRILLQAGADINTQGPGFRTALFRSAWIGDLETLNCLVAAGADINICDDVDSMTALGAATQRGHLRIVQTLLQAGADTNAQDHSSLVEAVQRGNIEILKCLLDAGADVNQPARDGITALEIAVNMGHSEIVQTLLQAGADTNAHDHSSLLEAVRSGYIEILNSLLDAGADVNQPSRGGMTALEFAVQEKNMKFVRILLQAGADVNRSTSNRFYMTALITAILQGSIDVMDILLEAGADPGRGDWFYESAFAAALEERRFDMYERLMVAARRGRKIMKRSVSSERKDVTSPLLESKRRGSM